MIIHVKPDKNHRPTYIYENEPVNRHPDLPPGAITIGDVFCFIGRVIKEFFRILPYFIFIFIIISFLILTRDTDGRTHKPISVQQYDIHR